MLHDNEHIDSLDMIRDDTISHSMSAEEAILDIDLTTLIMNSKRACKIVQTMVSWLVSIDITTFKAVAD